VASEIDTFTSDDLLHRGLLVDVPDRVGEVALHLGRIVGHFRVARAAGVASAGGQSERGQGQSGHDRWNSHDLSSGNLLPDLYRLR